MPEEITVENFCNVNSFISHVSCKIKSRCISDWKSGKSVSVTKTQCHGSYPGTQYYLFRWSHRDAVLSSTTSLVMIRCEWLCLFPWFVIILSHFMNIHFIWGYKVTDLLYLPLHGSIFRRWRKIWNYFRHLIFGLVRREPQTTPDAGR